MVTQKGITRDLRSFHSKLATLTEEIETIQSSYQKATSSFIQTDLRTTRYSCQGIEAMLDTMAKDSDLLYNLLTRQIGHLNLLKNYTDRLYKIADSVSQIKQ